MRVRKLLSGLNEFQRMKAERLFTEHGDTVYAVALGLLQDRSLAEDARQEAFVRAIGNIDKIDENNVNASRKYMEMAARSAATDILRSRGRLSGRELAVDEDAPEPPDPGPGPAELLLTRELLNYIKDCIRGLKPIYQDVFLLRTAYGHNLEETARILGISPSAAEKRYFRAKKQILSEVEEYIHD